VNRTALLGGLLVAALTTAAGGQGVRAQLVGTWTLVSRTDSGAAGVLPADGVLGADPVAMLFYDSFGNVSAQLMARSRPERPISPNPVAAPINLNNSAASGGFDSYFGRYTVDEGAGTVTHELRGALAAPDVGRRLTRHFELAGDTLRLWFDDRRVDGASVRRRLLWRRVRE
jgi:hypothetical protein